MNITSQTKTFAVLGHPVGHSLSPAMHNAALESLGLNAVYLAYDVVPEELAPVLEGMARMGFGGVNLTVPHKEIAFRWLDNLDDSAKLMGAANTIVFSETGLVGYNTDGWGFTRAVEDQFGFSVKDRDIFIAGTGGAGRAVGLFSAQQGARSLTFFNRTREKAERLAKEVLSINPEVRVEVVDDPLCALQSELVVNGSSLGMQKNDPPLLPAEAFHSDQKVMDLIYTEIETPFMRPAIEKGADVANGLGMLLHQGAKSLEIWTGKSAPVEVMRSALEAAVYG
jgi:shikimate dehydrogenase